MVHGTKSNLLDVKHNRGWFMVQSPTC